MNTGFSTEFGSPSPAPPRRGVPKPRGIISKRLFLLRVPLMIVVALLIAVPCGYAVWEFVPAQFRASTLIRFDAASESGREYEQFLATEMRMIEGHALLLSVLDDPGVQQMPWLMDSGDPLALLQRSIEVQRLEDSDLVAIMAYAPVREEALTLASVVEAVYLRYAESREQEAGGSRLTDLYDQQAELQAELDRLAGVIRDKRLAVDGPLPEPGSRGLTQADPYRHQYSQAQSDVIRASNEVRQRDAMLTELLEIQEEFRSRPGNPIHEMDIEISVSQDPRVASLANTVADAENEIATLEKAYQPDSPQLSLPRRRLEARQAELRQSEIDARRKLLEARISRVRLQLAEAQSRLNDAEERTETFGQLIAGDEERASQAGYALEELRLAEQDRVFAEERLARINDTIARIERESTIAATVRSVGVPSAPNAPDATDRNRLLVAVLMAAGFMGFGAGLLREWTDQQVRTPQDVGFVTPLPVLAAIPLAKTGRRNGGRPLPWLTADSPASQGANELRRILARVIYPPEGSAELNTCLIASPGRGDGKTSIAANLAMSLANANRSVLLIDLCASKPRVEETFGLEPAAGLAEVLLGAASPNDLVRSTNIENLFVLGPGLQSDALVGKLASRDIVEFLERAEEAFEHVIIDTAPALLMSDAKLLAPIVDGVFIVCGAGVSTLGMLRRCVDEFEESGAHVIGIVLNGLRPHAGGYLAKNLRLYNDERGVHTATRSRSRNHDADAHDDDLHDDDVPMIILLDEAGRGRNAATPPNPAPFDESYEDEDEILIEDPPPESYKTGTRFSR